MKAKLLLLGTDPPASGSSHTKRLTAGFPQSFGQFALALLATPPSIAVFLFIRILAKLSPESPRFQVRKVEPIVTVPKGNRAIKCLFQFVVYLYHHSLLHWYLHRHGYQCPFIPSCTDYAVRAVAKYGFWRGLLLTGSRFRRCSPAYTGDFLDFP